MVIRKMNKKGAEGDFRNIMVGGALSLVVLGLLVFFLGSGAEKIKEAGQLIPAELAKLQLVCPALYEASLSEDFCYKPISLNKNAWMTCHYAVASKGLQIYDPQDSRANNFVLPTCPASKVSRFNEFYFNNPSYQLDDGDRLDDIFVSDWRSAVSGDGRSLLDAVITARAKLTVAQESGDQDAIAAAQAELTAAETALAG